VTYLTRETFKIALAKGLGRAMIHVKQNGLDNVADLVLTACLHNQTYAPQFEGSRADWLFAMFKDSSYYPRFQTAILKRLHGKTALWDRYECCNLAKEMALHGDDEARQSLRQYVINQITRLPHDEFYSGSNEWFEVAGNEGAIELARIYGQQLLDNPDYECEVLYLYLDKENLKDILAEHAHHDPLVKRYWDYLDENGALAPSTPVDEATQELQRQKRLQISRKLRTLDNILSDARAGVSEYPRHYMFFGRIATSEELEKIYTNLLTETNDKARIRLLWVFKRAILPRLDKQLFEWANSSNQALRNALINALAQLSDPQVHDLARQKMRQHELLDGDSNAIDLFIHNYDNDAGLIMQALTSVEPNDKEAYDLGFSIIKVAEQYDDLALANPLRWLYENSPCTLCREDAIFQLIKRQRFDQTLVNECLFDARATIRAFAKKKADLIHS